METEAIDDAIDELEVRLERLRSLYEQYFLGIEKIEPSVARKDVDRRIWLLRREKIRNTARRFKLQTIIQRYNTFQQYWQRICREIENGTYRRHLIRAERNFGPSELLTVTARRRFGHRRGDSSRAPAAALAGPAKRASKQPAAPEPENSVAGPEGGLPARSPLRPSPAQAPEPSRPVTGEPSWFGTVAAGTGETAARAHSPPTAQRAQSSPNDAEVSRESLRPMPIKSIPPGPPPGKAPSRPPPPPRPVPTNASSSGGARPAPPPRRPAVPQGAVAKPPTISPAARAGASVPVPEAPEPRAAARRARTGEAPPARPKAAARAASDGASNPQVRHKRSTVTKEHLDDLHARLVAARRETQESQPVNKRALARQLQAAEETLRAQHGAHRSVEFDVVIRGGRAVVKPTVR